jgi:hypothetical protein
MGRKVESQRATRRGRTGVRALAVTVLLGLATALVPVRAGAAEESNLGTDAAVGVGTALVNVLYIPLKLTYATVGGVVGGLAYLLTIGDYDVANEVWQPTLGGSYIVTPSMLTGDEPFRFSGGSPEAPKAAPAQKQWPD